MLRKINGIFAVAGCVEECDTDISAILHCLSTDAVAKTRNCLSLSSKVPTTHQQDKINMVKATSAVDVQIW
eukprot:590534-Amphidinium_carterae.1